MRNYNILAAGDKAVVIEFKNKISPDVFKCVKSVFDILSTAPFHGISECVPAFRSILIYYKPEIISYKTLIESLNKVLANLNSKTETTNRRVVEIPVVYGGIYGLDIENVLRHTGLSLDELINRHRAPEYLIYMLGFMPGFAYLGGLDKKLETPRLQNPRTKIPWGSVGIGGNQTGIYPLDSPGGWQLIGRTPLKPYDPKREQPFLYNAGDYIKFIPISEEEYLKQLEANGYDI